MAVAEAVTYGSWADTVANASKVIQASMEASLAAGALGDALAKGGFVEVAVPLGPEWNEASDERVLAAALEAVNLIREEHNMKPLERLPAGTKGSPNECVIARALRGAGCIGVGTAGWEFFRGVTHPWPPAVQEFVGRFDRGRYPELEARQAPSRSADKPGVYTFTFTVALKPLVESG